MSILKITQACHTYTKKIKIKKQFKNKNKTFLECDNYHIKVEHDYKCGAHNP